MIYEFAVDPTCLKDWQTFRYLIEQFGVSRGRLVSQFPKDWVKQVYGSCSTFTFRQKQQLEIELKRLKCHGLIRSGREFEKSKDWVSNALSQFEKGHPFHAVIVNNITDPPDRVLIAAELTQTEPYWKVSREIRVVRTVKALGDAVGDLLTIARRIIFVDKMFEPASTRWQTSLASFISLALQDRETPPIFEYHTKIHNDEYEKQEEQRTSDFKNECTRYLSSLLPQGVSIKIVRWDRRDRGDFFHERCILTEKGGIRIDWGLDVGKPGETTLVSLLDDAVWRQAWDNFQKDATTYQFIDAVTVVGSQLVA